MSYQERRHSPCRPGRKATCHSGLLRDGLLSGPGGWLIQAVRRARGSNFSRLHQRSSLSHNHFGLELEVSFFLQQGPYTAPYALHPATNRRASRPVTSIPSSSGRTGRRRRDSPRGNAFGIHSAVAERGALRAHSHFLGLCPFPKLRNALEHRLNRPRPLRARGSVARLDPPLQDIAGQLLNLLPARRLRDRPGVRGLPIRLGGPGN